MAKQEFTRLVLGMIRSIPQGRVSTYGGIATMAGNSRGARQVVRILHACSEKEGLPWYRVVNREGRIALKSPQGHEEQKRLLEQEGIEFDRGDRIDLKRFLWRPFSED